MIHTMLRKAAKNTRKSLFSALFIAIGTLGVPATSHAQNLFAPVVKVNDSVITAYELSQRIAFLRLLRAPGDVKTLATDQLIEERLQLIMANSLGITITAETLVEGMTEFAGRADLTVEKFIEAIAQGGVSGETFRDFVSAGMIWREVVRAKFLGNVVISDAEIDRAIQTAEPGTSSGQRVMLAEIVLPANTPASRNASRQRAAQLSQISSLGAFASAASRYSVAPSKGNGGKLGWRLLSDLPGPVAAQVRHLSPGGVTSPIPVRNGIALFQVIETKSTGGPAARSVKLDYAQYFIPGGRTPETLAIAAQIESKVDTCDDLNTIANGQPESQLTRQQIPLGEVPTDIALQLSGLDNGEVSTGLTANNGQSLIFLMLCSRTRLLEDDIARTSVESQLQNQRLALLANNLLQEMRANAYIEKLN